MKTVQKFRNAIGVSTAIVALTLSSGSNAGILFDSGFDLPGINLGDTTANPITSLASSALPSVTWILGGHDNNSDDWDIESGVASSDAAGTEAQGLLQWITDGKATKGQGIFTFDLLMRPGQGDFDLLAYVFGWNTSAPGVDFENGKASKGDSFIPNGSTSLIAESTGAEGSLVIANNGVAVFGGNTNGTFATVTASLDFGIGYDNLGVLFYAENSGGVLQLDNVQISKVPAPATLALFGLGLAGLSFSRRQKA